MKTNYFVVIFTIIGSLFFVEPVYSRAFTFEPAYAASTTASYLYCNKQSIAKPYKVSGYKTSNILKTLWKGVKSAYFYIESFISFIAKLFRSFTSFIDGKTKV